MSQVKKRLVVGSVLGAFLLVYGTAIVFRLVMGNYFMDGGLANPTYLTLALLCAIPFAVSSLIGMNKNPTRHIQTILMGAVLFSLLFSIVHGVFVFSAGEMNEGVIIRTLIVFPISALLIVLSAFIGMNMGRPSREN